MGRTRLKENNINNINKNTFMKLSDEASNKPINEKVEKAVS